MIGNTSDSIDMGFKSLIQSGAQLLHLFKAEKTIEPKHIAIIREWIKSAVSLIESITPSDTSGPELFGDIQKAYESVTSVLPGDAGEAIASVLSGLQTAHEHFTTWCNSDSSCIPSAVKARACHRILNETWRFSRDKLVEMLKGKEDGPTKRTAMLHSYGRMCSWVQSMVTLGDGDNVQLPIVEHVYVLAGSLRAMFELSLDINLLASDKIEKASDKFFFFEKVARNKVANNSLNLHERYGHLTEDQVKMYSASGPDVKVEIDESISTLWGRTGNGKPNRPNHWTGMTVIERVRHLGGDFIRYYQHSYHYSNWCLHSGYVHAIASMDDAAWLLTAHSYSFVNEMFRTSTRVLIAELSESLDERVLVEELQKATLRGAHILRDTVVKAREEK